MEKWPTQINYVKKEELEALAQKAATKILGKISAEGGRATSDLKPVIGIVLGSGMQEVLRDHLDLDYVCTIPFGKFLPFGIPPVFQNGHKRELVIYLHKPSDKLVAVSYGRIHFYETRDQHSATFLMRVFKALGCQTVMLFNAAGGLKDYFNLGDIVITGSGNLYKMPDPLINLHPVEFIDPKWVYDQEMVKLLSAAAQEINIPHHIGSLWVKSGPCYESSSELQELIAAGADVAGMSGFNEAIVAHSIGLKVVGASVVANPITGRSVVKHEDVAREMQKATGKLEKLIAAFLNKLLPVSLGEEVKEVV